MRNSRLIGRIFGLAAVTAAVAALATLLIGSSGGGHTYKLLFQNASQLVKGNLVQVSGDPIGKVSTISLTPNGQAQVEINVQGRFTPLREGTRATVRAASLSGIANRYIDLTLAPDNAPAIHDDGTIGADSTTSAVDLDQIFNVFGPRQRKALSDLLQGFATTYAGEGANANSGFGYLNPSLAASARLFGALNADSNLLRAFIDENAKFVSDVAVKQDALAGLVDHLATTTTAIGRQRTALADAIGTLPSFMRNANSTFVNLRATLDDLKPLVDESKPVAKKLRPFLAELRPVAREAKPTIHDLALLVSDPKAPGDLLRLTKSSEPVRDWAIGPVNVNGASRQGSFPESVTALQQSTPEIAFNRPYAVDLTGWFTDFSVEGIYDALGAASRAAPYVNSFATVGGTLQPIPPDQRAAAFNAQATLHQNDRCPGAAERNPSPVPASFECDPKQVPAGP